jgi:hypothetical protein
MSSWRAETSRQTQDEMDELLDVSVRAAQHQLEATGEFYPFAVALPAAGDSHLVTPEVRTGPREIADVTEVHDLCWEALRAEGATLRAGSVVTNVGGPDGDAIAVALEHLEGRAIEVMLPYAVQRKTRGKKPAQKILYGDLQAAEGRRRVWTS